MPLTYWPLLMLAVDGGEKVDQKNWSEHPQIVAVREVVAEVDRGAKEPAWSKRTNETGCVGLTAHATLWRDAAKKGRRLIAEFGSGDSGYAVTATYDENGTLRFVLVRAGAVNGTEIQQRTWFDAAGAVLWRHDRATGPGYTWWRYEPKSKRLADAERAFKNGGCLWE